MHNNNHSQHHLYAEPSNEKMQNTSEPRLPTNGLKSHNYGEEVGYLLLAILPVTLFAGLL